MWLCDWERESEARSWLCDLERESEARLWLCEFMNVRVKQGRGLAKSGRARVRKSLATGSVKVKQGLWEYRSESRSRFRHMVRGSEARSWASGII